MRTSSVHRKSSAATLSPVTQTAPLDLNSPSFYPTRKVGPVLNRLSGRSLLHARAGLLGLVG